MKFTRREHRLLALLAHAEAQVDGPVEVPEQRTQPAPRRPGRLPADKSDRLHVDGSHRRDRWTYRPEACGWVLEGLPSHNRMGRPAGIARETIEALWPVEAPALRRMVFPAAAEADRRACQFRSVRR